MRLSIIPFDGYTRLDVVGDRLAAHGVELVTCPHHRSGKHVTGRGATAGLRLGQIQLAPAWGNA